MDHDTPFEPLNDLEVRLLQAQDGTLTASQFLDGLLTSTAFVLLDKAIGEDGAWDEHLAAGADQRERRADVRGVHRA